MSKFIGYKDDSYKDKSLAVLYKECEDTGKRIDVGLIYSDRITKERTDFGLFMEICEKIIEYKKLIVIFFKFSFKIVIIKITHIIPIFVVG